MQSTLFGSPLRRRDGCSECKRKKVRCDLSRPVCSRCTRFPKECKYDFKCIVTKSPPAKKPRVTRPTQRSVTLAHFSALASQIPLQVELIPSPFLSSPAARFFMHHFGTQTAPVLFPLAPPAFAQRLVSAALHTPHLLHALLASACSHHARLVAHASSPYASSRSPVPVPETAVKFTYLAVAGLRAATADPAQVAKAETAMTAMALCTNDVCDGISDASFVANDSNNSSRWWRVHLAGVRELLNAFISREKEEAARRISSSAVAAVVDGGPLAGFLTRWFATMDTVARVSGVGKGGGVEDDGGDSGCWALVGETGADEKVDEFCGYRLELMPILARIGRLAKLTQREEMALGVVVDWDVGMTQLKRGEANKHGLSQEAEEIEEKILSLAHDAVQKNTSSEQKARDLQSTNRAFLHAALLHLHRRVMCLPKDHTKVREDIFHTLSAIDGIPISSTANILALWPIFSAGCETENVSERETINTRVFNMQTLGMGNYTGARQVLLDYWSSGSPLRWDMYLQKSGLDLVLF